MDQSNAGIISFQQFIEGLAEMTKLQPKEVEAALSDNVPNAPLFDYIAAELKPHYQIGMLSNASANWLTDMLSEGQLSLFDAIDLSYETGNTKPAEAAYRNLAEKLGVATESCVFIDDQPRYCTAARDVGMKAIEYQNYDQLRADLDKLLDRS
jgi:putative hydrolase of the HAD superfamily